MIHNVHITFPMNIRAKKMLHLIRVAPIESSNGGVTENQSKRMDHTDQIHVKLLE